jgi:low molecular weight protein-tyrosine phosphatase
MREVKLVYIVSAIAVTDEYSTPFTYGLTLAVCRERGVRSARIFVCTGNICRSPTAERLAAAYAARLHIPDFTRSSAGTRAMVGSPMHHDAALLLESLGGQASDFAARQLTPKIASDADLVLAMTKAHRDAVLELAPRQLNRTFTLSETAHLVSECNARDVTELAALRPQLAAHDRPDIPDPIGQSQDVFMMVASQIADLMPRILQLCRRG